ncbi:MAG: protein rep [Planctomycetes bacterium]|nr:protein rep [Planctomycetota bacterium]
MSEHTSETLEYLHDLFSIRDIGRILYAFGINDLALKPLLQKTSGPQTGSSPSGDRFPRLDTTYSNIRGDTLSEMLLIIPPDLAKDFANHERISRHLSAIFLHEGTLKSIRRANRISACQQAHLLFCAKAPKPKTETCLVPYACNSRCCPVCTRAKSSSTFARVHDTLSNLFDRRPIFIRWITLTVRNPPEGDLQHSICDLLKAFRRLRRPREMNGKRGRGWNCWTENVDGYIWNLEVTHNLKERTWHPHLHILYGGDFIYWKDLKIEWEKARRPTGRPGDIKIGEAYWKDDTGKKHRLDGSVDARDALECLMEICKYTLKPFESGIPASCVLELSDAVFNKRLFGSGGDWALPPAQKRDEDPYWALQGGLAKTLRDSANFWDDEEFGHSVLQSCASSRAQWLRVVRNYDVFYWTQIADSYPEGPPD